MNILVFQGWCKVGVWQTRHSTFIAACNILEEMCQLKLGAHKVDPLLKIEKIRKFEK